MKRVTTLHAEDGGFTFAYRTKYSQQRNYMKLYFLSNFRFMVV